MKHPGDHKACFRVATIKQEADLIVRQLAIHSPLEKALINVVDCLTYEEEEDLRDCLADLDRLKEVPSGQETFEDLKKDNPTEKPKVELKALPAHLKYVFLEDNATKPVMINNNLSSYEEARLIEVLRKHKEVIGWYI